MASLDLQRQQKISRSRRRLELLQRALQQPNLSQQRRQKLEHARNIQEIALNLRLGKRPVGRH